MAILHELNDEGRTIVLITHDADVAARANRQVHVRDGRIVVMKLVELLRLALSRLGTSRLRTAPDDARHHHRRRVGRRARRGGPGRHERDHEPARGPRDEPAHDQRRGRVDRRSPAGPPARRPRSPWTTRPRWRPSPASRRVAPEVTTQRIRRRGRPQHDDDDPRHHPGLSRPSAPTRSGRARFLTDTSVEDGLRVAVLGATTADGPGPRGIRRRLPDHDRRDPFHRSSGSSRRRGAAAPRRPTTRS